MLYSLSNTIVVRKLLIIITFIFAQLICVAQKRTFKNLAAAGISLNVGPNTIDSLTRQDFQRFKKIVASPASAFKIERFEIIWIPKRGEMVGPFISNNDQFSAEQLDLVKRLQPDNVIYLNNVQVRHATDSIWTFNFLPIKIIGQ